MTPLTDFDKLNEGDLIFIRSHSDNAPDIAALTGSQLTHCGIVFREKGKWIVLEGAGRGEVLSLPRWQEKESGDHALEPIFVRRLQNAITLLAGDNLKKLRTEATRLHDTRYDFAFAWSNTYQEDGTKKEFVYCSELLYKAYDGAFGVKLGAPHPMRDYIAALPAAKVEAIVLKLNTNEKARHCRGGKDFDPEDLIISPQDVYASSLLVDVTD